MSRDTDRTIEAHPEPGERGERRRWRADPGSEPLFDPGEWGPLRVVGRRPLLGAFLVLLGGALLLRLAVPTLSTGGLFLLALGLTFGAAWLGGSRWAIVPALLLLALAVPRLLVDAGVLVGEGWTALILAVALLAVWASGLRRGDRHRWALWLGALFGLYAVIQLSGHLPGVPDLSFLWPLLIIVVGILLLARGGRRERGGAV